MNQQQDYQQTQTLTSRSNTLRRAYRNYEPLPVVFENNLNVKQTQWLRQIVEEAIQEIKYEAA